MIDDRGLSVPVSVALGLVVLVVAVAAATGAVTMGEDDPDAETVLEDVRQTYASAETITGTADVTAENDTEEYAETVTFAYAAPDKGHLAANRSGHRYLAGTNGTVAWAYNASSERLVVRDVPEKNESMAAEYANVSERIEENVTATLDGTTQVGDIEAYVLELRPTNDSYDATTTMWVATDSSRVVKIRATHGENVTTVRYRSLQFNVSVHDSTFRPPAENATNAKIVSSDTYDGFEAAQGATTLELRSLDAGTFEEATVTTRNGVTAVFQEYTVDRTTVTVAATADSLPYEAENGTSVTVAGQDATYRVVDDQAVVVWTDDGVTRAVTADLPREELLDLATTLRE
jgi:outer membrane lipoprotein-sorting protein